MLYDRSLLINSCGMMASYLWSGNDPSKLRLYFDLICKCLEQDPTLERDLRDSDKRRILEVARSISENRLPIPWHTNIIEQDEDELPLNIEEEVVVESELRNIIVSTIGFVKFITDDQTAKVINYEHRVESGVVDVYARGEKTAYAVEIKLKKANHAVVGQIMKYMRNLGSRISYGLYEDVKGVVLANSFTDSCLKDLKSLGIRIMYYKSTENGINFIDK